MDSADRFINTHPDTPNVAYVLYMKGLSYFRDDRGILDIVGRQNPATRDPKSMQLSFQALRELTEQYPDSPYAVDATKRMRYLINTLAEGEIHVAEYYVRRGAMLAAISRAKYVLEFYPTVSPLKAPLSFSCRPTVQLAPKKRVMKCAACWRLTFPTIWN